MVNVQDFLFKNNEEYVYARVYYNNKMEHIYFAKIPDKKLGDWYLEYPCYVLKEAEFNKNNLEKDLYEYISDTYTLVEGCKIEDFIEEYIKPNIIDNILYEIECPQCSPFLPKEVDKIEIISERECLLELLNDKED